MLFVVIETVSGQRYDPNLPALTGQWTFSS